MADQSPPEEMVMQSSPRTSSTPHSPKWPHPGGGGRGERAWTKEPVYCRSHGPPPFVDPRAIRDLSPKRKEWKAQFPQPVFDRHCEFHGNATQDYFQRELRRISRTRLSMTKDVPPLTLEEFMQEKQKKVERSKSNQRERDRKSLRIIHQLEKENLVKHDSQSNKEFLQKGSVERPGKPLKGAKQAVLRQDRQTGLQDKPIAERPKHKILDTDARSLRKTDEKEATKVANSIPKDVHVGLKVDYLTIDSEKKGLKKDPWRPKLQKTEGKSTESRTQKEMNKPLSTNVQYHDMSPLADVVENAITSQAPNVGGEILEELEDKAEPFPSSPAGEVDPFSQPYQWIFLPQTLRPAPIHIEGPYSPCSHRSQRGRNPTSAVTVPVTLLSSPILLGYHDTSRMPREPILVGH